MTDFIVNVTEITGTDTVGAQVTIQDNTGVQSVHILEASDYNTLQAQVNNLVTNAITDANLVTKINSKTGINADTLDGSHANAFASSTHNHDTAYAIKSHTSVNANDYGGGTSTLFGHSKVINNVTTPSHSDGVALSAYQGKVLKDLVDSNKTELKTEIEARGGFFIVNTWAVQKNNNLVVDCYNADGTVMTDGTVIEAFFKHLGTGNTITGDLSVSNGKITNQMSTTGDYLIVFAKKTDTKINKTVMVSVWE